MKEGLGSKGCRLPLRLEEVRTVPEEEVGSRVEVEEVETAAERSKGSNLLLLRAVDLRSRTTAAAVDAERRKTFVRETRGKEVLSRSTSRLDRFRRTKGSPFSLFLDPSGPTRRSRRRPRRLSPRLRG